MPVGSELNRRMHPRVHNDQVSYRPPTRSRFERVMDISPGGMRVFAPDCLKTGERLPLELRLPDGVSIELWAEVAWSDPLFGQIPPGCESGLRFTDIPDHQRHRLALIAPTPARSGQPHN